MTSLAPEWSIVERRDCIIIVPEHALSAIPCATMPADLTSHLRFLVGTQARFSGVLTGQPTYTIRHAGGVITVRADAANLVESDAGARCNGPQFFALTIVDCDWAMLHSSALGQFLTTTNSYLCSCNRGLRRIICGAIVAEFNDPDMDFVFHRVNMLPAFDTAIQARYIAGVSHRLLDRIVCSWTYSRRSPLARVLNMLKTGGIADQPGANGLLGMVWEPIVSVVAHWMKSSLSPVAVIPVPSTAKLGEELAAALVARLRRDAPGRVAGPLSALFRSQASAQMRDRLSWADRERLAETLFSVRDGLQIPPRILLVDDVLCSGSSLRRCAKLVRDRFPVEVSAAVVCGCPEDAPPEWYCE